MPTKHTPSSGGPTATDYALPFETTTPASMEDELEMTEMTNPSNQPTAHPPLVDGAAYLANEVRRDMDRLAQYNATVVKLNRPINRELVKQRKGYGRGKDGQPKMLNYLEHHTVTRLLNDIFGPGRWSVTDTKIEDFFDPSATDGIPRAVRVTKTLSFNDVPGFEYARIEMTGYQVVQQPTTWENGKRVLLPFTWGAYEMALGNAEAKAFKRAAAQLGESLGLALYQDDAETTETDEVNPSAAPRAQQASGKAEPTVEYGDNPAYCEDCGGEIRGYTNKQTNKKYTTDDLVNMSRKYANGRVLCYNCRSKK